jgi:hypothetical protein
MSEFAHNSGRFFVRECAIVTVAFSRVSSDAIGLPTMLDRPTTRAFFPSIGIENVLNVQGRRQECRGSKQSALD